MNVARHEVPEMEAATEPSTLPQARALQSGARKKAGLGQRVCAL